ncbi:MAG TPA: hypothetical protein PLE52_07420 [Paludibacteraceae bacterium]|nr:hypothetical protein [Paludibacteraceae bacterium]
MTDIIVDGWIFSHVQNINTIILDSLTYCQKEKGLIIYAWVLMSNHLHTIVGSAGPYEVSEI